MQIIDIDPTTPANPGGHAHAADLEACLDLINSEEFTDGVPEEHLPTVDDARRVLHAPRASPTRTRSEPRPRRGPGGGDGWLRRLYARAARCARSGTPQVERRTPDQAALDAVNALLRAGAADRAGRRATAASASGTATRTTTRPARRSPASSSRWSTAIAAGETDRFRICANDGCRWVFEDTSRAGRRRWCDMSSCGNRAKVRRYRSKQRTGGDAAATARPPRRA